MRFGKDREDEENPEKRFFHDDFDDFEEMQNLGREIHAVELSLVEANLNRRLLVNAIKSLESSWFWKFTPYKTKLKMITETYKVFAKLISESDEE